MLAEILEIFADVPAGVVIDATLGGAGHTLALLEHRSDVDVIGFDQDPTAVRVATDRLASHGARARICHARFDRLAVELDALGIDSIVGVLFDLGVSSHQLDEADRGFSFRNDGPLDMRMNTATGAPAADLVNGAPVSELARVLRTYGDERHATRIARAIEAARPLQTTTQLAQVVVDAMPAASRRSPGHPARRTFQALRIAVNDELGVIEPALHQAIERMQPGGRGAVLSYHSGEDRIVKHTLRSAAGLDVYLPPGLPVDPEIAPITLLHRKSRQASADEQARNPRSSAARLRTFVRNDTGQLGAVA